MSEKKSSMLEAKYVSLRGNTNIGGFSAANLDELRDGYALHLHQESGGVYASKNGASWFIPAMSIQSVDLKRSVLNSEPTPASAQNPLVAQADADAKANADARAKDEAGSEAAPEASSDASKASGAASTLADDVLAEFSEDKEVKLAPKRRKA